ncbi:MAG: WYL domain-containing protein [Armatimonadota bacterium]|nr:WYL domain-containing protein [Armatimonadota bacterium]
MAKSGLLLEMIQLLRQRPGITVEQLAQAVGRSERTVYRWLREISSCLGARVTCDKGGYYLNEPTGTTKINLAPEEIMALRLSLSSAPFAEGSPVKRYSESAWRKIRDGVAWDSVEAAEDLAESRVVRITAQQVDLPQDLLDTLNNALDLHHRLKVVYRSQKSRRVNEYTIEPYALTFRRHSWYMLGYCPQYDRVIQMKLIRIISAVDTGEVFEPPENFSVDEYFATSWEAWGGGEPVKVRVLFTSEVAQMIAEVQRHPTQKVYPQQDGNLIFEVTVSGLEEIAAWIMGFGKHAVVLEPRELRQYILDHVHGMAAAYEAMQANLDCISAESTR